MASSSILYNILWLLLLVFIAWPVSWFLAWWWCLLIAFEGLFPVVKQATDFLEKMISWPRTVGKAMLSGDKDFPMPW
jgi:hypothetical protein